MDDPLQQTYIELGAWSSPLDFKRRVDSVKVKSCDYWTSRRFNSLREAWVLAEFALLIKADRVRLNLTENSPADGYVKISGDCREVQITEALKPGREIGNEYKSGPKYRVLTCEEINDADDVAEALTGAIEKKIKRYGSIRSQHASRPMLVVSLELGVHGRQEEELRLQSQIAVLKERYAAHFGGIYVLQSGKLV